MPTQLGFWVGLMLLGCLGVGMRFFLQTQLQPLSHFPWSTLLVNITGSFFIGGLFGYAKSVAVTPLWLVAISVGLLGALTTFSSYSLDTVQLIESGRWMWAALNVSLQNIFGIGSCYLGYWLMQNFFS